MKRLVIPYYTMLVEMATRKRVQFLIIECKCDIDVTNSKNGNTLLHTLCYSYSKSNTQSVRLDILIFLIEKLKLEICKKINCDGISSLESAISSRWVEGVKRIYHKAYYNCRELEFTSYIVSLAYLHWNESIISFFLVEIGYPPLTNIETGDTVLHEACKEMRLDKLKFLVQHCNLMSQYPTLLHAFSSSYFYPSNELLFYIKPMCTYSKNASNFTPLEWVICHPSAHTLPIVRCLAEVYGTDELYTEHIFNLICKYWSNDLMKYLLVETNYCLINGPAAVSNVCSTLCDNGEFTKLQFLVNECQVHIHDTQGTTICYSHPKNNSDNYRQCSSISQGVGVAECSLLHLLNSAIRHRRSNIVAYVFEKCYLNLQKDLVLDFPRIFSLAYCSWEVNIIKYLLSEVKSAKITPVVDDSTGDTILHKACQAMNMYRVKFLVEMCGCNPHIANYKGETLIHIACQNFIFLQYLCINCYCCPDLTDDQNVGTMAMKSAIAQDERGLTVIKHLVEKCKVKGNHDIMSFVHIHWCPDIVEYLIVEAKFDIYTNPGTNTTILHMCASLDPNCERLKHLIDTCHCSPHIKNKYGESLIHATQVRRNCFDILQYLCIECNCCPDLSGNRQKVGTMAMKSAIAQDERGLAVIKHLVEKCKVKGNCDIMSFVYIRWCPDIVEYLIVQAKFNIYTDYINNTILHLSALDQDNIKLGFLIDACHCSPHIKNDIGESLIHTACRNYKSYLIDDHFDVLKYLCIHCNCCPDLTDYQEVGTVAMISAIAQKEKGIAVVKHFVEKCKMKGNCNIMLAAHRNWCPDIMQYLIAEAKFDLAISNRENILHLCARNENYEQLRFLFEACHSPITNEMATYIVQYMVPPFTHDSDISYVLTYLFIECKCIVSVSCQTLVNLAIYCCAFGAENLSSIACHLVETCIMNDGLEITSTNSTFLHMLVSNYFCDSSYWHVVSGLGLASETTNWHEYSSEFLSLIDCLIYNCHCDVTSQDIYGNTVLHLACNNFRDDHSLIELIMSTGKADPLCKNRFLETPLMLLDRRCRDLHSDDVTMMQIKQLISRFGEVQIAHPIHLYVSVVLLGNPGVGKSTLAKVIKDRIKYSPITAPFKNVKGVEFHTAGIIPNVLNDKDIGRIILHDLAGQAEYYTSHTAVLENLLQGSAAVFVLVDSLADGNFIKSFHQWLNIIENISQNALHQCHLILIVSHADQSTLPQVVIEFNHQLKQSMVDLCSASNNWKKSSLKTHGLFNLDCRKLGGGQLVKFISALSTACKSITDSDTRDQMSLYCHILYDFLQHDGKSVYTLQELTESATKDNGLFLDISQVDNILSKLNATGLIVFLRNHLELAKSWIVADKAVLLSDLNGILFAPQEFKQHHVSLASNTGVVKLSDLHSIFPEYNQELLLQFLQHMELCSTVSKNELMIEDLADCSQSSITNGIESEQYIFIPALIKCTERPMKVNDIQFKFGWCLRCSSDSQFFLSRFLHLVQLRLAFMFSNIKFDNTFDRYCNVWTKGIYWPDTNGVHTLVEVSDSNQALIVLMSCKDAQAETNMYESIHDVLAEILSCKQQIMPQVVTNEYIIDSSSLHSSLESLTNIPLYRVHLLARCYINNNLYIMDDKLQVVEISKIVAADTCNRDEICTAVFAGRDPQDIIDMKEAPIKLRKKSLEQRPSRDQLQPAAGEICQSFNDALYVDHTLEQSPVFEHMERVLKDYAAEYMRIGRILGLDYPTCRTIDTDNIQYLGPQKKLSALIYESLQIKPDTTWKSFIAALRKDKMNKLANEIEEFLKSKEIQEFYVAKKE